jgi:peptidoglycan/LPS O-acetylase OafA/YrhL
VSDRALVKGHLWQMDIVRLLTFTAVISVHTLAFTEQRDNRLAAGAMMVLQFGREVFFSLTGFVLVYSMTNKRKSIGRFWGKRILYVAVPYIVWSGIYYAYSVLGPEKLRPSLSGFGWDLLYGNAMYHLYFLLVTLQLYLVFPLLLAVVQKTADRWKEVLAVVGALNLGWLGVLQWTRAPSGWGGWVFTHAYELLPTYSMYVLAGCYAAVHLPRLQQVFQRRSWAFARLAAICLAAALGVYAIQLAWMAPRSADSVLQPAMLLSCLGAAIVLYMIGCRWAAGPRRQAALVATLSDVSFGVYLAHPLILQILLDHGLGNTGQRMAPVLATLIGFAGAVAGGTAISLIARRTPLSLALTGRRRTQPARREIPASSQMSPSPVLEPVQLQRRF